MLQLSPAVLFAEDEFADLRATPTAPETKPQAYEGAAIKDMSVAQAPPTNPLGLYEYRIGPMDVLEVDVFQSEKLGRTARVNTEGYISLPLIGSVVAAGKTTNELEREVENKLSQYMQEPHVTVFIKEYQSQKITIEGWVNNPGIFPLTGKTTFLQAIARAKGMDRLADFDEVAVFRTTNGKTTGYVLSYSKIRKGEQIDPVLQAGDIIVVNRSGSKAAWKLFSETLTSFVGWSVLF